MPFTRTFCPALLLCLLATACANRPDTIKASYVAHEKYMDVECEQLGTRMADARASLTKVSELQNNKANGDAFGVFLLGIPFSKLSGDHEADVARWKGEIEAIDTAQIRKKCK